MSAARCRDAALGAADTVAPAGCMTQPAPSVTPADVARVIRRDFSAPDVAAAEAIVREYGQADEPEPDRVRLAALKLAAGSLEELRRHIGIAKMDFRDVLLAAEYPKAGRGWVRIDRLAPEKRQEVYDADWEQYEDWLKRE
jgi:hypothetical protein